MLVVLGSCLLEGVYHDDEFGLGFGFGCWDWDWEIKGGAAASTSTWTWLLLLTSHRLIHIFLIGGLLTSHRPWLSLETELALLRDRPQLQQLIILRRRQRRQNGEDSDSAVVEGSAVVANTLRMRCTRVLALDNGSESLGWTS